MRVTSTAQLVESIKEEHSTFCALIEGVPPKLRTAADVWGDGWSVKDLVLHMTAWEQMFLTWYRAGKRGEPVQAPAAGYTWKEMSRLNHDLQRRLARRSWKRSREEFDSSYAEILRVAKRIDESELLERGRFAWTGTSTVGVYFAANTASHYKAGTKILKRWQRAQATTD